MIVAIAYHDGDLSLMKRWAKHVASIGLYLKHKLILVPIRNVETEEVLSYLSPVFGEVIIERATHAQTGWPISCNMAFEAVAWLCSTKLKQPFLWMEPDAVPIQPQWIDSIELAYSQCGKPFMGDYVEIAGIMPNGVNHMSGIAVYDWDLHRKAPSIFNNERTAWDIASANNVVPQMARTKLIQHDWVPTKEWRRAIVTKDCVNSLAVIYHPDKLGVLFNDGLDGSGCGVQANPVTGGSRESSPHEVPDPSTFGIDLNDVDRFLKDASTHKLHKKYLLEKIYEYGIIKRPIRKKKAKKAGNKQKLEKEE
jgi:hypothetical protein